MKRHPFLVLLALALLITSTVGCTLAVQNLSAPGTAQSGGSVPAEDEPGGVAIANRIQVRDAEGGLTPPADSTRLFPSNYTDHIRWSWKPTIELALDEPADCTALLWDSKKLSGAADRIVQVTNTGGEPVHLRTVFAFEADTTDFAGRYAGRDDLIHLNRSEEAWVWAGPVAAQIDGVAYDLYTAVYTGVLQPGETTPPSLLQFAMSKYAGNAEVNQFGSSYDLLIRSQAVQAVQGTDAAVLMNAAFGEVTAEHHPWNTSAGGTASAAQN